MAKHAILTKRSQRVVAAMATSGLLATGIAVPIAQVASANVILGLEGSTCTIETDVSFSQAVLRHAIESAISDSMCEAVEINSSTNAPIDLEISGTALRIGASDMSGDTRRSFTIKSTTGLNVKPGTEANDTLFVLEDNSFETITIEGLTFRDASSAAIDGEDFDGFGDTETTLRVKNSRFINNGSFSSPNGALLTSGDVEISNSIFSNNFGQAVYALGDATVSGSLFIENEAESRFTLEAYGGAVWSAGSIYSVNSTYLDNSARGGGALFSQGGVVELALNTFSGNDAYSWGATVGSTDVVAMWGNIFTGPGIGEVYSEFDTFDLGYNLTDSDITSFTAETSKEAAAEEWNFGTAPTSADVDRSTPVTTAPVLPLTSSSVAVNFVRGLLPERLSDFFEGKTSIDQLGKSRGSVKAAGAHQVTRRSSSAAAPVVVQTEPKRITVPGFAANSTKLTRPMRAEIRKFLRANPDLNNVVCRGFTSSPVTAKDRVLARNRGKVACDYIKTLRPEAKVTIRSGSHTNKPGKQIRRVSITLR